jgi:hypothetical protein
MDDVQTAIDDWARTQSAPLGGTVSAATAIARVKYSHDAMIDLLIARPEIKQGEIALQFGYTQAWVSRVMNSDAFLARLAQRKSDIVDPSIALTLDEKFRALADQSLDVIMEKLTVTKNPDTALKALELTSKALGYGARQQNLNVQQNFVVAMPNKVQSPEDWAAMHQHISQRTPGLAAMVQDVTPVGGAAQ